MSQGFVLAVTMVREAVDEVRRHQRDKEMNSQLYSKLTVRGETEGHVHSVPCPSLKSLSLFVFNFIIKIYIFLTSCLFVSLQVKFKSKVQISRLEI